MSLSSGPSDHFLQHGRSHRCECGRMWYDSDGGPCHETCNECEKLTDVEDLSNGLCPDCINEKLSESEEQDDCQ